MNVPCMIDAHVHFRDEAQRHKETIENGFRIADSQGVRKVIDMPNVDPPVFTAERVDERVERVPDGREEDYFVWMGVTDDPDQVVHAADTYDDNRRVAGFKMYAGHSVGRLGLVQEEQQRVAWQTLADAGYNGPVAVHCEKEALLSDDWDPQRPVTHAMARPEEAEVESVRDQIGMVKDTGFDGTLYVAHVSSPQSVELIQEAKEEINAATEVTPHHVMWDVSMLERPDGLFYKMNPPLRSAASVEDLRDQVAAGNVDVVGTDHAPHQVGEKLFEPYMSGFPSLFLYREFVEEVLPGLGASQETVEGMVYGNHEEIFDGRLS